MLRTFLSVPHGLVWKVRATIIAFLFCWLPMPWQHADERAQPTKTGPALADYCAEKGGC